jgi:hypothetical protein
MGLPDGAVRRTTANPAEGANVHADTTVEMLSSVFGRICLLL